MSSCELPRRPCPVCLSSGGRELCLQQRFYSGGVTDGYDVVICENCGAVFADGVPPQAVLDRYYAEQSKYTYAHAGGAESKYDFRRFEIIADQVESVLHDKSARILDIGCATGGLLSVLRGRGFQNLVGSDPNPGCAEHAARLHRVEVRVAAIRDLANWEDKFDAVLLVGVLEHLRDLGEAIQIAKSLLSKTGIIYCAQPDLEGFADCSNAPYQQFSTEHINYFSAASLRNAMARFQLREIALWNWVVEWRRDTTDSVVSAVYRSDRAALDLAFDHSSRPALARYLETCFLEEQPLLQFVQELVARQNPVFVWGTGTLTRRLLVRSVLARANIVAFVNSSAGPEETLAGRPVWRPAMLARSVAPIIIFSRPFADEIERAIREDYRLDNAIIRLP